MSSQPSTAVLQLTGRSRLAYAPFDEWEYGDVEKEMKAQLPKDYHVRKMFALDHDHFQGGSRWVGPGSAKTNTNIQQQFAPEDAVGEVLNNVSNAFSEPQLGAAPLEEGAEPTQEVQSRIDEAITLLSDWWDRRRLQELIQDRQRTGAWAGMACLRTWISWRFLEIDANGAVTIRPTSSMEDALNYIHITAPLPEHCMVLTDPGTQEVCAVYLDEEVEYVRGEKKVYKRAEMVFLDPKRETDTDADTIVRIVYSDPEKKDKRITLELGGQLTTAEMRVRSLFTDPVLRTQDQLNLLTTLITRIAETAAFRERYTTNARPQGLRVLYNDGDTLPNGAYLERDDEGRQWMVVPQPRTLGANTTTELVGLPKYDDRGEPKGYETPGVDIVDPVDPKPYLEAGDATRRRILRMCAQGHLGGISNAEASGIAYEQARAVFEKDLNARRVKEEGMLRDLLTSVLATAEWITNQPGYFTDVIRITIDQHINPGPRSPDLIRLELESYEAGAISKPTLMSRLGIEDTDAEMERVSASAAHILAVLEKAVAIGSVFEPDSVIEVLKELGLPDKILNKLVAAEVPPTTAVGIGVEE